MAPDMLLLGPDEVARNGAFGKSLRPEVFPNAPLHSPFVEQRALRSISWPSPEASSLEVRMSRESRWSAVCSVLVCRRKPSGENQLFLYVDASLAQQLGDRISLESRGVEPHPHRPLFLVELYTLNAIDLADAVNGP